MKHHKRVTVDFSNYNAGTFDLAVPIYLPIKKLLLTITENLDLPSVKRPVQIKVITKKQLLTESDCLADFHIADGDILKVI